MKLKNSISLFNEYLIGGFKMAKPEFANDRIEVSLGKDSTVMFVINESDAWYLSPAAAYDDAMLYMKKQLEKQRSVIRRALSIAADNYFQGKYSVENNLVDGDHYMMGYEQYQASWDLLAGEAMRAGFTMDEVGKIWEQSEQDIDNLLEESESE